MLKTFLFYTEDTQCEIIALDFQDACNTFAEQFDISISNLLAIEEHAWPDELDTIHQEKKMKINFNINQCEDVEIADVFAADYPDFCDAYVESATFNGVPLTDDQLDILNDLDDTIAWVNENAFEQLLD